MTLTVPLPPELGLENLHQAIGSYVPVAAALQHGQPVDLCLDLSAVRFIWPSGMALLAAMVLAPDRQGRRAGCQVVRPAQDKVDSYLTRMDFYNLCQLPADYPWPRFDATGRFREVVEVASEAEANAVVADLWAILQAQLDVDAALGHAVRYALAEVMDNVFHHARSPVNAIVCAQTYPQLNQLELAIVDAGRGIPASLADNPALRGRFHTASQAIQLAVQPKVTSRPDHNAGEGLFFTTEFLRANGGAGCIYSLDGLLEYREGRPQAFDDVPRWPGTIVALRFDTRRPVDVQAIFNRHAPPADDFAWLFEAGAEPAPGGPGPAEPAPPAEGLDWLFE